MVDFALTGSCYPWVLATNGSGTIAFESTTLDDALAAGVAERTP